MHTYPKYVHCHMKLSSLAAFSNCSRLSVNMFWTSIERHKFCGSFEGGTARWNNKQARYMGFEILKILVHSNIHNFAIFSNIYRKSCNFLPLLVAPLSILYINKFLFSCTFKLYGNSSEYSYLKFSNHCFQLLFLKFKSNSFGLKVLYVTSKFFYEHNLITIIFKITTWISHAERQFFDYRKASEGTETSLLPIKLCYTNNEQ